jgi:hypothetical protein
MDAIVCYEACGRGRIHLSCIIRMHLGIFFGIIYVKGSFGVKIHVLHLDYWEMDMINTKLFKEEDASKIVCGY